MKMRLRIPGHLQIKLNIRPLHFPMDMKWMNTNENMWLCHEVLHGVALIEYGSTWIKTHHFLVFIIVILHDYNSNIYVKNFVRI